MSEPRQIQVIRRETKSYLPSEIVATAKVKIGSVLKGQTPLSGLTREEEIKYVSGMIGYGKDSPNFERELRKYWANFFLEVPQDGKTLNITTTEDGEPVNLQDWIVYRWIQRHPLVADDYEQFKANPTMMFYIRDPEVEKDKRSGARQSRTDAYKEFIALSSKKDDDKIDRIIRILSGANPDRMDSDEKRNYLENQIADDPDAFLKVAQDKDLDTRAEIDEMIEKGVLRRVGNHILFVDDPIGHSMEEAILFFKNPKESQTISIMKQRLKEAQKTLA